MTTAAPIAITMGDPAGIGPEIVAKLISHSKPPTPIVVIGDAEIMRRATALVGSDAVIREIEDPGEARAEYGVIQLLQVGSALSPNLPFGAVSAAAGAASFAYVETAARLALQGRVSAMVTAPINKAALKAAGINYPGHTEILGEIAGSDDFAMMLATDELRVVLVSTHESLRQAIEKISHERVLRTIEIAHKAGLALGIDAPRVAVAGLNPHAGEEGLFGTEDRDIIAPAIASAQANGIDASGPWPADTLFMRARNGDFDIVVAQYHDQGLIPIKLLGIDQGVNITVGLPFIRTSVDHGTAFDIAGKGMADHASLAKAVSQAEVMAGMNRQVGHAAPDSCVGQVDAFDFIFMLTRQDRTVADAQILAREAIAAGIRHIGFKDVGLPIEELHELTRIIKSSGATAYLEVVSLDEESERRSAITALQLGVDVLMGGTRSDLVLPFLKGSSIRYLPFPGQIVGHPSKLEGSIEEIAAHARFLAELDGVHGVDLLAYRSELDPEALIRAVSEAVGGKQLVVAGSIDNADRIRTVRAAGANGFTVGTAAIDGVFDAPMDLRSQLSHIDEVASPKAGPSIGPAVTVQ